MNLDIFTYKNEALLPRVFLLLSQLGKERSVTFPYNYCFLILLIDYSLYLRTTAIFTSLHIVMRTLVASIPVSKYYIAFPKKSIIILSHLSNIRAEYD